MPDGDGRHGFDGVSIEIDVEKYFSAVPTRSSSSSTTDLDSSSAVMVGKNLRSWRACLKFNSELFLLLTEVKLQIYRVAPCIWNLWTNWWERSNIRACSSPFRFDCLHLPGERSSFPRLWSMRFQKGKREEIQTFLDFPGCGPFSF